MPEAKWYRVCPQHAVLQMDDTTVQVLKVAGIAAQNKSYMWVMRGGPPDQRSILFNYDPGWGQQVATRLIAGYQAICKRMHDMLVENLKMLRRHRTKAKRALS